MMLRLRYIFIIALSLFIFSCSNDDSCSVVGEYSVEVVLDCGLTKVGIDGNDLFWQSGDQIALRAVGESGATATAVLTLNDVDSGLSKAKFKGSVIMSEVPVSCEFAYPSTAFDVEGETIFDYSSQDGMHKPYLYGEVPYESTGMECTLGHIGGLLRLQVAEGVESVSLSSNSGSYQSQEDGTSLYEGQKISKVILNDDGSIQASDDASHMISATVPSGSDMVYVFMPAMEFVEGFSIVCNHSDGSKMFRSFSETGGNYSSYDFQEGAVLDIDLSTYEGFTADCSCDWEHIYESKILTGTKVTLKEFTFSGSPQKIIDQWGVGIFDSDGNFIRWVSGDGVFDGQPKEMTDQTGNWPLLIPGEYVLYAICSINGHTLKFPASNTFIVGYPKIQVTPVAETSWSYKNNPQKANACGNNTIERLGLKVNVSHNILNHSNTDYGFKVRIQNTTADIDTGEVGMNVNFTSTSGLNVAYNQTANDYELKQGDGFYVMRNLAWGTHNVTVLLSFAGNTYSSYTTAYVTGLPFRHNFKENHSLAGGTVSGGEEWHKYNGLELRYYYNWLFSTTQYTRVYYSPSFPIPSKIEVSFKINVNAISTGSSSGTYTAYTGIVASTASPSTDFITENLKTDRSDGFDTAANANATNDYPVEGTGTINSSSRVSASTNKGDWGFGAEHGVHLSYMEILYK